MKKTPLLCSLIFLALLLSGCAAARTTAPEPVATQVAALLTRLPATAAAPAPSATPEPVTLDTICTHVGETADLQGILRLPVAVACSLGLSPEWCSVQLYDPYTAKSIRIDLFVSADPQAALDHMAALPKPYAYTDFRVGTVDGGLVGHGSLVSLSGKIAAARSSGANDVPCKLSEVQGVRALQQLASVGIEVQSAVLQDAIAGGWVAASGRGKGLERIDLALKSLVDYNLEVTIPVGTILEADSGVVQNMVVRQGTLVVLRPGAEATLEVEAACANMGKKEPGGGDTFHVDPALAGEDLRALLALPELRFLPFRLQQFAVWTITDDPAREYYVGVSTSRGISQGPSVEEFEKMKELFSKAGIDPEKYKAFR